MRPSLPLAILSAILVVSATGTRAADNRSLVELPAPMREHMITNMRDHLAALGEIQAALAKGEFGKAADIAENRIGMSSMQSHGASHMAPHMPKAMREIGTAMHRSASRFAATAQEAAVTNDLPRALAALTEVTQHCVACHAGFRTR